MLTKLSSTLRQVGLVDDAEIRHCDKYAAVNGDMPEKKLDLIQLSASQVAQVRGESGADWGVHEEE